MTQKQLLYSTCYCPILIDTRGQKNKLFGTKYNYFRFLKEKCLISGGIFVYIIAMQGYINLTDEIGYQVYRLGKITKLYYIYIKQLKRNNPKSLRLKMTQKQLLYLICYCRILINTGEQKNKLFGTKDNCFLFLEGKYLICFGMFVYIIAGQEKII